MRLQSIEIKNYRNINYLHISEVPNKLVIVGGNNSGKSNILNAINFAMKTIKTYKINRVGGSRRRRVSSYRSRNRAYRTDLYDWDTDFPFEAKSGKRSTGNTTIKLEFRLSREDQAEFYNLFGIKNNETLPFTVEIGDSNIPNVDIPKQRSNKYKKQIAAIGEYISGKIRINYIDAIRTEETSFNEVRGLVQERFRELETNEEYCKARSLVESIESGFLSDIGDEILPMIREFNPDVNKISICRANNGYSLVSPDFNILIDDGRETSLEFKGDGIKSLMAMSLLRRKQFDGASVVAIEEPESHLHPEAIRSLVRIIDDISENNQVIVTTHNALFVNRYDLSANILVEDGEIRQGRPISEIREALGIWSSDNLMSARLVVLVEGLSDRRILESILRRSSASIDSAVHGGVLAFESIKGTGNLSHRLFALKHNMCSAVVILDNDNAGKSALEVAKKEKLIEDSNARFVQCPGLSESEIEDIINPTIYASKVLNKYNIDVSGIMRVKSQGGKILKSKWSDRIEYLFNQSGANYDQSTLDDLKTIVADSVCDLDDELSELLIENRSKFIDNIVYVIESELDKLL